MNEREVKKKITKLEAAVNGKSNTHDLFIQTTSALGNLADNIETLASEKASKVDPRLTDKRAPLRHEHQIKDVVGLEATLNAIKDNFKNLPQFYTTREVDKLLDDATNLSDEQKKQLNLAIDELYLSLSALDKDLNKEIQNSVKALEIKIEEVKAYRPEKIVERIEVQKEVAAPTTIVNQIVDTIAIEKLKSDYTRLFKRVNDLAQGSIDTRKLEDDILAKIQAKVELKNQTLYITRNGIQRLDQLIDVDINNPINGQALTYNSTTGLWENDTINIVPVGSNPHEVTYINSTGDALATDSGFTYNPTTDALTVNGLVHTPIVQAHTSAGLTIEAQGGADVALFGAGGGQNVTFFDGVKLDARTASEILATDASKNIQTLSTTTYPNLTELSYLKGVTSVVQSQLDAKASTRLNNLSSTSINESLVPESTSEFITIGLGETPWNTVFTNYIYGLEGQSTETVTVSSSTSNNYIATTRYVMDTLYDQRKIFPRSGFHFFTDFINETSTTATDNALSEYASGGNATQQTISSNGNVGVIRISTAGTATGRCAIASSQFILNFGNGEWFFEADNQVIALSDGTNRYGYMVGFIDAVASINQTDAAYFLYDEGGVSTGSAASANWQIVTSSNSTRTFTTTSVPVSTNYARMTIEVNADGTSVAFYIDGNLVGTHTTNIPNSSGRLTGFGANIIKSIGATARLVELDYINVVSKFTTPR